MDVFNQKEKATQNLQLEKGNFLWFKLFVEVLIHMTDNTRARSDLIEMLRISHPQSSFVADLDQNYTSDNVIEWFLRADSCLLEELNKALRQQHLDHLFAFRYLINDIYQQLKKQHDEETKSNKEIITLYRSQAISQYEIDQLCRTSTGDLIAINSFMSTWSDRTKAIKFLMGQQHPSFQSILFEIEVDYRKKSNPFARINADNDITLFMVGCVFRTRSILEDDGLGYYVLKLELCSNDDVDLKTLFDYMTLKDFIQPETDLITLGNLLYKMGELDKARRYFELILTDLDIGDPNYAHCYDGLGNIENDQGKLDEALKYHQQALELRMNHNKFYPNDSLIALSHIHIANDYTDMGIAFYHTALAHVKKARHLIQKQNLPEDQAKEAVCHVIEGSILHKQGKSIHALDAFQQALGINKQQGMPDDHPTLASIYQNMALCHLTSDSKINNATLALNYCVQALMIRLKALPNNHRSTGITYRSIGLAYEQSKEYQSALEFYKKANNVHKALNGAFDELRSTDDDIERIQEHLLHPTSQTQHRFQSPESADKSFIKTPFSKLSTTTRLPQSCFIKASIEVIIKRIILLGRSSAVKNSFGNILLDQQNCFMINRDSSLITNRNENSRVVGFRDFHGKTLMIINTPDFNDENSTIPMVQTEMIRSLEIAAPGPHAFLLVLEFNLDLLSSEEDDEKLTELLRKMFGSKVFQYIVFVFTNLEKLQAAGIGIDEYMEKYRSRAFIDLMTRCGNRYVSFNNNTPRKAQVASIAELLLTIDRMLDYDEGKIFTTESIRQKQKSIFTTKIESTSTDSSSTRLSENYSSDCRAYDKHNLEKSIKWKETHRSSIEKIDIQSAPRFDNYLLGLSIQPYHHCNASSQQSITNNIPVLLKPISNTVSNILIACFNVDSSLMSLNSPHVVESFVDDCECITRLLSMTGKSVYFVVSSSIGEYIIPIIYQHRCIEHIYVYCSDNQQSDTVEIARFPKVRHCWADYTTLITKVRDDIQSISSRSSLWSNLKLIERCYTQTLIKPSNWPSVPLDLLNVEKYSDSNKEIRVVVLHCGNSALLHIESQQFHLEPFSDATKCIDYLKSTDVRSLFFIISGETRSIMPDLKKISILKEIYAVYLFAPSIDEQELDETLHSYKNIGRLFDNLEFLLTCLTSDIKFYFELPLYRPILSIFASKNNIKDNGQMAMTDDQKTFAAFQIFINTLREAPASICRYNTLHDRCSTLLEDKSDSERLLEILQTETSEIFQWFTDAPFLFVIMNSFLRERFLQNVLHIRHVLMNIDQRFAQLSPTTSSSVVYRVQLISEEDLKAIQVNVKELVAFHTYPLVTKDLITARTIARQAADRGLSVIVFQIEIPTQSYVLEVDNNRSMFRFGAIFSIRSVDLAPDNVWYAQLKYADADFHSIEQRIQIQMGEQITWLTLGNCLSTLNHANEAKFYYDYLIDILSETHQAVSSIYNNMGLVLTELKDTEGAKRCFETAMNLLGKKSRTTPHLSECIIWKTLPQLDEVIATVDYCIIYDKMAEVYVRQSKHEEALKCYRKAVQLTNDPLARVRFEQQIKNILSLMSSN